MSATTSSTPDVPERSRRPTSPNEILRRICLQRRNIDLEEFIETLGRLLDNPVQARDIVMQSEPISIRAAVALSMLLDMPSVFWIDLQAQCDYAVLENHTNVRVYRLPTAVHPCSVLYDSSLYKSITSDARQYVADGYAQADKISDSDQSSDDQ